MNAAVMGGVVGAALVAGLLALAACGPSETWSQTDARHDNETQQAMPPGCTATRFVIRGGSTRWLVRCPEGVTIAN